MKADDRGLIRLSRGDLVVGDIVAVVILVLGKQLFVILVGVGVGFLIPKSWVGLVKIRHTWDEGNYAFKCYSPVMLFVTGLHIWTIKGVERI
jgi:hypothetical protein